MALALLVLRYAWPWLLAATIWGVQEARVEAFKLSSANSHKREIAAQSSLDAARQRATDLALLYANTLPKIGDAARQQEAADHETQAKLQTEIDRLSRKADLRFDANAWRVWRDVTADGGHAAAAAVVAGRADPVPVAANSDTGAVYFSQQQVIEHDAQARAAYLDALRKFHETRDLYNAARAAQLQVKGAGQ